MTIGSATNAAKQIPMKVQPTEAAEATRGGKDVKNDGDADDAVSVGKASSPKPVLNLQGQEIGKNLHVTA